MSAKVADRRPAADDLTLAKQCASGDRAAQLRLFREHRARVHGTLYRILGRNSDMEDLVQEVFLEVFRSIGSFRGDAKLATWLTRIATRVTFSHIARRKPATASLDLVPETQDEAASAEQQVMVSQASRRLYALLDRVEAKHRIAFALHVLDGRPLKEVAALTDSSLVATKSRIWRTRRELRRRAKADPHLHVFLDPEESA